MSEDEQTATERAGRNLPAAIVSGVILLVLIGLTLFFVRFLFVLFLVAVLLLAVWELKEAVKQRGIQMPYEPVMFGTVAMPLSAWFGGTTGLLTALAITAVVAMLWRLQYGVDGYVRDASVGVFIATYVPFLAGFVALMLVPHDGVWRVLTFIIVTISSDIGGYAVGATLGRHPLAPSISPKKSWEGFAGSAAACVLAGVLTVVYLLHGEWWVGVVVGLVAVVAATLGDLLESVIKRDLGIKDMSHLIPGHGGMMDRLDSLLVTAAPIWVLLYFLVK
jgi:phosphatidate cytidylyltransferase